MVLPSNTDASVTLTFRIRDNVSGGLQNIKSNLRGVQDGVRSTGSFMAANANKFIAIGAAGVIVGQSLGQLGVQLGILDEEQGKTFGNIVQGASSVAAGLGGLALIGTALAPVFAKLTLTGIGAFATKLVALNPLILAVTATTLALAVAVSAVVLEFQQVGSSADKFIEIASKLGKKPGELARDVFSTAGSAAGTIRRDPGKFGGQLADLVKGGLTGDFTPAGQRGFQGNQGVTIVNQGTIIADEGGLRELFRRISALGKEDDRVRGTGR